MVFGLVRAPFWIPFFSHDLTRRLEHDSTGLSAVLVIDALTTVVRGGEDQNNLKGALRLRCSEVGVKREMEVEMSSVADQEVELEFRDFGHHMTFEDLGRAIRRMDRIVSGWREKPDDMIGSLACLALGEDKFSEAMGSANVRLREQQSVPADVLKPDSSLTEDVQVDEGRITPENQCKPRIVVVERTHDGQFCWGEKGLDGDVHETTLTEPVFYRIEQRIQLGEKTGTVRVDGVLYEFIYMQT